MTYSGIVIHGLQNGRKFGFPTANIQLDHTTNITKGVYAVMLEVLGQTYKGMLYVGTRPTLNLNELSFEIHILDFHKNIYDERLSFDIVKQIRNEQRFDSTTSLINQLKMDRKAVRATFANPTCRYARKKDLPTILSIIQQAKQRLKTLNINQWQDGYPDEEAILNDIAHKQGYLFVKNGTIIAYVAICFEADPFYASIDGKWLSNQPYVVVHRLAVSDAYAHQGVAKHILQHASKLALKREYNAFRIDTHYANHYMRNLIRAHGFILCGLVQVRDGQRLAYEKILKETT